MPAKFLRLAVRVLGVLLTAASLLSAFVALVIFVSMTTLLYRQQLVTHRDWLLWRWSGVASGVGGLLTWASYRLVKEKRPPGEARVPSFTLVRSQSGRQERYAHHFGIVVWLVIIGGWIWERLPGDPWLRALESAGCLAAVFLFLHGRILLHELGHLCTGALLGLDLWSLHVGKGRQLGRFRTRGGFEWKWRVWPSGGHVLALHREEKTFRWRQFVLVSAGPLVDGLVIVAVGAGFLHSARAHALPPLSGLSRGLAVYFVFVVLVLPMLNGLIPQRIVRGNQLLHTDGWWMAKVFFLPDATVRETLFGHACRRVACFWEAKQKARSVEELKSALRLYPEHELPLSLLETRLHRLADDPAAEGDGTEHVLTLSRSLPAEAVGEAWAAHAAVLAVVGRLDQARADCAAVLAQTTEPADRASVLDAFACLPLLHLGGRAFLPEAKEWCREALLLAPDRLTLRGTWGALLVEQGQAQEGAAILREVFARTALKQDRGIAAFFLALAARKLGDRPEMQRRRQQASRLCEVPALLVRLRKELT